MAGRSLKSFGSANKDWSPGPLSTRYNVSGKSREYYTFENAPGIGAYATGGTIVDGGDGYIYHIFTGPGTFQVNRPSAAIDSVDYLVVAGGGGGQGGAGGGGGMLFGNVSVSNTPGAYPVSVGAGGGPTPFSPPFLPAQGNPSSIFGITAYGGGYGGSPSPVGSVAGGSGGSGGGGYTGTPGISASGGTGNIPNTVPRQGYPGGVSGPTFTGGGGGGAGGPGGFPQINGPGKNIPQFPVPIVANGIPASNRPGYIPRVGPTGFSCGGGSTGISTANSGAGAPALSGSGSSGIVCVRYKKTAAYSRATGGTIEPNTHPEHPGVWRHIFTSPGTFTVTDPSLQWIDYLAVGGGGGGGYGYGGGGGAGGFVSSIQTSPSTPTSIPEAYLWSPGASVQVGKQYSVSVLSYSIAIGTGGTGGSISNPSPGGDGSPTTIGSPGPAQIIAYGGGGGGSGPNITPYIGNGRAGASGGGVGKAGPSAAPPYGVNGPAVPSPLIQGNAGFAFIYPGYGGAGGAGAGSGGAFNSYSAGGGSGWYSVLSPSAYGTPGPLTPTPTYRYFAGGGGGGAGVAPAPTTAGTGGAGGGGNGGPVTPPTAATSATTNTGSGGGGGSLLGNGGNGAPGIVIIQYPE